MVNDRKRKRGGEEKEEEEKDDQSTHAAKMLSSALEQQNPFLFKLFSRARELSVTAKGDEVFRTETVTDELRIMTVLAPPPTQPS
ncbi:hypothetical protein M8J76_002807 [Diaphorina citri]|nr:hypothetical protein M8J76_002807 [Diaphorina citri]